MRGRNANGRVGPTAPEEASVTIVWFVIWLVANIYGGTEPLSFDPVNIWAGGFLLTIALDLNRPSTREMARRGRD